MGNTHRTTGSLKFRLKESVKDEKPIFLDYSYGRKKRFKYAIGYSVNPKYWDEEKLKVRNVVAVANRFEINDLIRDLETELFKYVAFCDSNQILLSNNGIRDHLKTFTKKAIDEPVEVIQDVDLFSFIKSFINRKSKELPIPNGKKQNETIKSYKQTLTQLMEFSLDEAYKLDFDKIDEEFYSEFIDYMNNKTYGKNNDHYALNTIGKHIKTLKTFMNAAVDVELLNNLKFRKFKEPREVTTAIYLTLEEQKRMLDLDLSKKPNHQLARDIFIIGCEIGQRISDYRDLSSYKIEKVNGEEFVRFKQKKTDKEVLCIITKAIRDIMDKRYNGKMPPKIAEQKLNDYIKEVGKKAGLIENVRIERTVGGKKTLEFKPKYELIMGHTARRSFCTIKYQLGVPVHSILELSGHSTDKEFMKYIRNPKEDRVSKIALSEAFKNASISI